MTDMIRFEIDQIVCINLISHNLQQLFMISEHYDIDFEFLVELRGKCKNNVPGELTGKTWFDMKSKRVVAQENRSSTRDWEGDRFVYYMQVSFYLDEFSEIADEHKKMMIDMKPAKNPKAKIGKHTLWRYKMYLSKGYDIKTNYFERALGNSPAPSGPIEKLSAKNLEKLMLEAVEEENYERAAELRDMINSLK